VLTSSESEVRSMTSTESPFSMRGPVVRQWGGEGKVVLCVRLEQRRMLDTQCLVWMCTVVTTSRGKVVGVDGTGAKAKAGY
jgi:hypothetical protein